MRDNIKIVLFTAEGFFADYGNWACDLGEPIQRSPLLELVSTLDRLTEAAGWGGCEKCIISYTMVMQFFSAWK